MRTYEEIGNYSCAALPANWEDEFETANGAKVVPFVPESGAKDLSRAPHVLTVQDCGGGVKRV
jgi:hypothetical protein